jgi:hypothetical protein
MIFKAYAIQTLNEAQSFTTDLKLGHYVKVPPRSTFLVQMVATILAAFVQVGVKDWMFNNIPNICQDNAPARLTCPHNRVFFTSSAVFGLIGPSRQFGAGALYHPEVYALIVGAFLPIPFWLWQRRRPGSVLRYVNVPVFLNGVMYLPPATGINYSSWFAVGFVFQYLLRRRNFAWWSKFNYITSAALDSGACAAAWRVRGCADVRDRLGAVGGRDLPRAAAAQERHTPGHLVGEHRQQQESVPLRPPRGLSRAYALLQPSIGGLWPTARSRPPTPYRKIVSYFFYLVCAVPLSTFFLSFLSFFGSQAHT